MRPPPSRPCNRSVQTSLGGAGHVPVQLAPRRPRDRRWLDRALQPHSPPRRAGRPAPGALPRPPRRERAVHFRGVGVVRGCGRTVRRPYRCEGLTPRGSFSRLSAAARSAPHTQDSRGGGQDDLTGYLHPGSLAVLRGCRRPASGGDDLRGCRSPRCRAATRSARGAARTPSRPGMGA